jgi:hypothetical protein
MNDTDRDQLRQAFSIELSGPPSGAEQRVLGGLDYGRQPRRQGLWFGVAAAGLAGLVIVTLLASRALVGGTRPPIPGSGLLPFAQSPIAAAPFPCRLPIERNGVGMFTTVSSGATASPGVPLQEPASSDPGGRPRLPDGEGAARLTYQWELRRWLPVAPEWVSPDGASYAYSDRQGILHVVSSAGTQERAVNSDRTWAVVAFQAEGVYAAAVSADTTPDGLWLIDPATGRARQLQASGRWVGVRAGVAWELTLTSPAPPLPQFSRPGEVTGNVLVRLDLQTGRTTPMYTSPSSRMRFVGVDAEEDALVSDVRAPSALLVVSGPGRVTIAASGAWSSALPDGDRTWLTDTQTLGVVLKQAGAVTTLIQVDPGAGGDIEVAGPCR